MEKESKFHYAWLVVLGCGMLIAGTVTFYTVVIGNFFVPAAESMGVEYSSISLSTPRLCIWVLRQGCLLWAI